MEKKMEKEKNMIEMINYNLLGNIYMVIKEKGNHILKEF